MKLFEALFFIAVTLTTCLSILSPTIAKADTPAADTYRGIQYSTESNVDLMDIVVPTHSSDPKPIVVFVHGGAWFFGGRGQYTNDQYWLASHGYASATIDYRLSGVAPWPAQIQDCNCAIRYLRAHAVEYNIDPNRIAVWGDSAGGHLVAMLGLTSGNKTFEGRGGWSGYSSKVDAVLDFFGISDIKALVAYPGVMQSIIDAVDKLLPAPPGQFDKIATDASPVTYAYKMHAPPFLIYCGDADEVVPPVQSKILYDALKKSHHDATLIVVPGAGHSDPKFYLPKQRIVQLAFLDRTINAH
jgi:acetyl esterase/lipase